MSTADTPQPSREPRSLAFDSQRVEVCEPTAPAVEVEFRPPGIALVKLRGEHDIASKQHLTEALATASAQLNVLVDLSECTFMDSTVIATFFCACEMLKQRGGRLELVIPQAATTVQNVAKLTALDKILPIHETQRAAVASFQPREHAITIRDLRVRFGDSEAFRAECSCGWQGETQDDSRMAGRYARRDGALHVDEEHLAPTRGW
jgi:anti-sigma B factor antagonist